MNLSGICCSMLILLFLLSRVEGIPQANRASVGPRPGILNGNPGTDRLGGDIKGSPFTLPIGSQPSDCAKLCLQYNDCNAWSFGAPSSSCSGTFDNKAFKSLTLPTCSVKNVIPSISLSNCSTSGVTNAYLSAPAYPRLPSSSVQPSGWWKNQLDLQSNGLAGHLHLFWLDVSDSEWIGGKHDTPQHNHERMPYWLNGMIALAYIQRNETLMNSIFNFTNYIIEHQSSDGFYGPRENLDPWPRMLVLYILQQYYEFNATDTRVIPSMYSYLHFLFHQYLTPGFKPQDNMWTYVRIQDMLLPIEWIYDNAMIEGQEMFLLDLLDVLYQNSWDWKNYYRHEFPTRDVGKGNWTYYSHGVNNGMALKSAAVWYRYSHDQDDVNQTYERMSVMDQYHGLASGIFSCDECLAGNNPARGSETCTVVEAMFSYATIFSIIGDPVFADKVERMTFNALPATMTPDMWEHQYLQSSNEINGAHQDTFWWNTDGGDSAIYGLEPNYGCCTVNYPQGFTKYLTSQYMLTQTSTSTGILAALLAPSILDVVVDDPTYGLNLIHIEQITDYPFMINDTILFSITAQNPFPFSVRIPSWAVGATVQLTDGSIVSVKNGSIYTFDYKPDVVASNITFTFPTNWSYTRRYNNATSLYYGPLLMAMEIEFNITTLAKYAFNSRDLAYLPTNSWNFAIELDFTNLSNSLTIQSRSIPDQPFDPYNPPLYASAYGRQIDWSIENSNASPPPQSPIKSSNPRTPISLIPFGSSMLRIAEIPTLE